MKINQLVTENKQRLDEKPMGILSKAGNTIMSKLGSGKASGKLQTGDIANKMHKEYDTYLGQTGEEASAESIIAFLKFKKYPTQNVAAYLASPDAQDQAPAGPGEAPASAPTAAAPAANAAPAEPVEPTMEPEAPAASAETPAAEPAAPKAAPSFNNQLAGGKQTVNTGSTFDPATMKNTAGTPAPTGGVPPTTAPATTAAPAASAEEPDLKAKIKARLGKPDTNFKGYQAAAKSKGIQNASRTFIGKSKISEAVSSKVVDKAILIAAQDAAKMGIGASIGAAPAASGQTAAPAGSAAPEQGGFMAGLKKGLGGSTAAPAAAAVSYEEVKAMVDKLAVADKQHLLTDLQKEVATAPTESVKRTGSKLAESKQYYSLFKK
jgi:hypothetical protein